MTTRDRIRCGARPPDRQFAIMSGLEQFCVKPSNEWQKARLAGLVERERPDCVYVERSRMTPATAELEQLPGNARWVIRIYWDEEVTVTGASPLRVLNTGLRFWLGDEETEGRPGLPDELPWKTLRVTAPLLRDAHPIPVTVMLVCDGGANTRVCIKPGTPVVEFTLKLKRGRPPPRLEHVPCLRRLSEGGALPATELWRLAKLSEFELRGVQAPCGPSVKCDRCEWIRGKCVTL